MVAALGGLDALVYTGGVGERAASIRTRAAEGLAFLGVALDDATNASAGGTAGAPADLDIGAPGAAARCFVVQAREDVEIAHGARDVLDGGSGGAPRGGVRP